jgi:hypothetical protein
MIDTHKKTAIIVGALFIVGTVAGVLSVPASQPILAGPDYLSQVAASGNRLVLGALLILVMGFSLAMIPIVIYPVLRKQNDPGHPVRRLQGAPEPSAHRDGVGVVLVPMSQEYVSAGAPDASIFKPGAVARSATRSARS